MIAAQFVRFCIIGLLCTCLNYGVFYLLCEATNIHYIVASAIGFISGTVVGYFLNKLWTFGVKKKKHGYVFKYFLVYTFSLVVGLVLLKFLVVYYHMQEKIAGLLIIGVTTMINFVGSKYWIFKA